MHDRFNAVDLDISVMQAHSKRFGYVDLTDYRKGISTLY